MKREFKLDFLGRDLVVETGQLAKQTNGSVLVRYGDTVVLSVCVMGNTPVSQDFFPLQVLYQEKLYSVGKIPGGFIKREGRPTDAATLAARLIDRPIRPMFDENLRNEIQVVNTVLSVDQDNSPEMAAMFGTSLALGISDIPYRPENRRFGKRQPDSDARPQRSQPDSGSRPEPERARARHSRLRN